MSNMNFTNNVTGGTAQINQGNVTATQNVSGGDLWEAATEAAETEQETQAVNTLREIVEAYPEPEMELPEADQTRLQGALGFLRDNGPAILRVASKVALSLPIAAPIAAAVTAVMNEIE